MKEILKLVLTLNLIILFCLFAYSQKNAAVNQQNTAMTAEKWREDLRFLTTELVKRHPNPFHDVSEKEFETAVKTLDAKIDELTPHQIIVEMAKIVALINEGHTRLNLPREGRWKFNRYPVRFYLYDNGLFIQEIAEENREIVGLKVVEIAGIPTKQVLTKIRPVVHHDNEMTIKSLLPYYINTPEVLRALGIIKDINNLELIVEKENGEQESVQLSPAKDYRSVRWISANESAKTNLPLWQKKKDNIYWFEYLENLKTVYVQLNASVDKKDESLAQFSKRLYNFIENNPVEKLVLDLRLNDGGNSRLTLPLLHDLIKSDKINQKGKFFTIIGRATFSAAIILTVWLEQHSETIFVGEPTGGSPNQYGDMASFNLPNSGLSVNYSTYYFQTAGPYDNRPWIAPQISVKPTIESFRRNQDPAFEAAVSYEPTKSLSTRMLKAYADGGIQSALALYREFKNTPENLYIDTEREVRLIGNQLQEVKKYDDAVAIFNLNVNDYPERSRTYLSLAELYFEKGEKLKAKPLYQKGFSLLESDRSLHKLLRLRLEELIKDRLSELK